MKRLWQSLLGTLIVSSLACGGSSGSGGTGYDGGGGLDGDQLRLDGAASPGDLALPSPDLAGSGIDQAGVSIDLAPSEDLGTPEPDAARGADTPASDGPAAPDVPMQTDLAGKSDVLVKRDVTPSPDLVMARDLPPTLDVASTSDVPPTIDVTAAMDVSGNNDTSDDTSPELDTATAIDTSEAVDAGDDATPQVLWPDKLQYSPGEQLTAHFTDGSTDAKAWVGIFPVGAADNAYSDWHYTGGETEGTVVLDVPGTAGTYELRMFEDVGYTKIASSVPFTVVE